MTGTAGGSGAPSGGVLFRAALFGGVLGGFPLAAPATAQADAESFGNPWMTNLRELGPPEPVPWWPPAPGWYALGGLLVLAVAWLIWRVVRRRRAGAYRRQALAELKQLESASEEQGASALAGLSALLKRAALIAYPRVEVAGLHGAAWHRFLDGTQGHSAFAGSVGQSLDAVAYQPDARLTDEEAERLLESARSWLRGHRRELPR